MDTLKETCARTSRKHVGEQVTVMPNRSETCQTFWWHSSFFALEKHPKNLNFDSSLTSKKPSGDKF